MHLHRVIEHEVGQKVKNRCSILTHRCVQSITRKAVQMSLVPGQKERQRQRAQTRTPRRKRAGCWWRICEIGVDTYTLLILWIQQVTNADLLHSTGNSVQCSVVTRVGRKSRKQGIYMHVQLIHHVDGQKLIQHWKATLFQKRLYNSSTYKFMHTKKACFIINKHTNTPKSSLCFTHTW